MLVACCSLCVVRCLCFVGCSLLVVLACRVLLFVFVCCSLCDVCCRLFGVACGCLSFGVCCLLFVVC